MSLHEGSGSRSKQESLPKRSRNNRVWGSNVLRPFGVSTGNIENRSAKTLSVQLECLHAIIHGKRRSRKELLPKAMDWVPEGIPRMHSFSLPQHAVIHSGTLLNPSA